MIHTSFDFSLIGVPLSLMAEYVDGQTQFLFVRNDAVDTEEVFYPFDSFTKGLSDILTFCNAGTETTQEIKNNILSLSLRS